MQGPSDYLWSSAVFECSFKKNHQSELGKTRNCIGKLLQLCATGDTGDKTTTRWQCATGSVHTWTEMWTLRLCWSIQPLETRSPRSAFVLYYLSVDWHTVTSPDLESAARQLDHRSAMAAISTICLQAPTPLGMRYPIWIRPPTFTHAHTHAHTYILKNWTPSLWHSVNNIGQRKGSHAGIMPHVHLPTQIFIGQVIISLVSDVYDVMHTAVDLLCFTIIGLIIRRSFPFGNGD